MMYTEALISAALQELLHRRSTRAEWREGIVESLYNGKGPRITV